jgi:hypothetical protein
MQMLSLKQQYDMIAKGRLFAVTTAKWGNGEGARG